MRFEGGRVQHHLLVQDHHPHHGHPRHQRARRSPNLVRRLPPPLRRYTSAARSAWNAASVQAQRAVSGQARARAQRRGRNGEGATTRAACRGGKPSCAVSSSIGPSSRSSPAANKSVRDIMDDTYGPRRLSQTRRDSRGLCTCILSSLCTQVRERSCCVRTLNERSGGCLNHQTLAPQSRKGAAGRGKSNFCRSDSATAFARSPQPQPQPVVVGPYMSIFELFYYLITSNYLLPCY